MTYDSNYSNTHHWLKYHFGKAKKCERCKGKSQKRYEYALIKGKKYEKKRENFMELCSPCHKIYDNIIERLTARKYKPVYATKENFTYKFSSIMEAAEELGILRTSIANALVGRSSMAGGYKWKYA